MKPILSALCLLPLSFPCLSADPVVTPSAATAETIEDAIARVVPTYVMIGGGSGVVVSADGLMLTNHHVIDDFYRRDKSKNKRKEIEVRVGNVFRKAHILGTDPRGDITLLRIALKDGETLPFVPFADSDKLQVGQKVMAMGNPFSAMQMYGDPTVTTGIISLLHWFQGGYSDAIMTDTPINPGNSGGPLLTMDGRLAGINGQIRSKTGARSNTGIGLAIPANQIARFLPLLEKANGGIVLHGSLRGVSFDGKEEDGLRNGAEVESVIEGLAAHQGGLQAGDRIVEVENLAVTNAERFFGITQAFPENATVTAKVIRGEEQLSVELALEPIDPGTTGVEVKRPKNIKELRALSEKVRQDPLVEVAFPITKVGKNSPAGKAGLKKGDQIITINGEATPNFAAYQRVRREIATQSGWMAGDNVTITYRRGKGKKAEEFETEIELDSRLRPRKK